MTTKELYKDVKDCCGCEACAQVCPKNIIVMSQDSEGFYYPVITNEDNCINCGRCKLVCPLKKPFEEPRSIRKSLGGYSKEESIIKQSASGGFAYTLSSQFIKNGGVVYGVCYSEKNIKNIEYTRCETIEQLLPTRGSKYVQSRKYDIYKQVKKDLKTGIEVLFFCLPCEVAALYHYIGVQKKIYTVNLICHGPTSLKVHSEYIDQLLVDNGKKDITHFSVRHKLEAWKPYYIHAVFNDNSNYNIKFIDTDYGVAFQNLKRPSCSKCRFKVYDSWYGMPADITIGDYHLARSGMPHYNHWGSSQVSSHSEKGDQLIKLVEDQMKLFPISEKCAVHYNPAFFRPTHVRWNRPLFAYIFKHKGLNAACTHWSVRVVNRFVKFKLALVSLFAKCLRIIRK